MAYQIKDSIFQIIEEGKVVSELSFRFIEENYFVLNDGQHDWTFIRKSILPIILTKYEGGYDMPYYFNLRRYEIRTNIEDFEWRLIDFHLQHELGDVTLINKKNCFNVSNLNLSFKRHIYFYIIEIDSLGFFYTKSIHSNSDSAFLFISLDNPKDSIVLQKVSRLDRLLNILSFPLEIKKTTREIEESNKKVIDVGMPTIVLEANKRGTIQLGNTVLDFQWKYLTNNSISINAYRKRFVIQELTNARNSMVDLDISDYQLVLTILKLENGKFVLSSRNCNGTIYKILN